MDKLLSDYDLEESTGRSRSSWQKDRLAGLGPKFLRIGRLVRYRKADVEAWLESRSATSTSDPGRGAPASKKGKGDE